jgi:hypothetical protein
MCPKTTTITSETTDDGSNPDGKTYGDSTDDLMGFYGVTPIVQPSGSAQGAVTITATTALVTATISAANSANVWAFASSTVANAYVARTKQMQVDVEALGVLLNKMRTDLVALGLLKGAA